MIHRQCSGKCTRKANWRHLPSSLLNTVALWRLRRNWKHIGLSQKSSTSLLVFTWGRGREGPHTAAFQSIGCGSVIRCSLKMYLFGTQSSGYTSATPDGRLSTNFSVCYGRTPRFMLMWRSSIGHCRRPNSTPICIVSSMQVFWIALCSEATRWYGLTRSHWQYAGLPRRFFRKVKSATFYAGMPRDFSAWVKMSVDHSFLYNPLPCAPSDLARFYNELLR